MEIITVFNQHFFERPEVAWMLIVSSVILLTCWLVSIFRGRLLLISKLAPSIMTAVGLLGTFIGLTIGLKDLELNNQASMQELIAHLKVVFIYSLTGILAAVIFMWLNNGLLPLLLRIFNNDKDAKDRISTHNKLQSYQESLLDLQKKQLNEQRKSAEAISKLQFDNDNEQLAGLITQGVVSGLSPLLEGIKNAIADQGSEAIQKILEDLKETILIPMHNDLNRTNDALNKTIETIESTQKANDRVIEAVNTATHGMVQASEKMDSLVDKIDQTVQHMDDIQVKQHKSLEQFNGDLQTNLSTIKPAIEDGLSTAKTELAGAINIATIAMQQGIKVALEDAGKELNNTVDNAFKQFGEAQKAFDQTLDQFSTDMNGHLDRMAIELQAIGNNAEQLINNASENLKNTLGDIDNKLLNTAEVLKTSLETFRVQYQDSLTAYLKQQTEQLDGFLDKQNEQLEHTIGKQREGLEAVTSSLTEQFRFMDEKQKEVNQTLSNIVATQEAIMPKVQDLAHELAVGERRLADRLEQSAIALDSVPTEIQTAFITLHDKYKTAFSQLDGGVAEAANQLVGVTNMLAQALGAHNAVNGKF